MRIRTAEGQTSTLAQLKNARERYSKLMTRNRVLRARLLAIDQVLNALPAREAVKREGPWVAGWAVPRGGGSATQLLHENGKLYEQYTNPNDYNVKWLEEVDWPIKPTGTFVAMKQAAVQVVASASLEAPLRASVDAAAKLERTKKKKEEPVAP